ncbi:MAG: tetratricopeptide repeat protein [Candidatus Hodarchaeales archaeon]|jgi:tetratricopeptide (TPR) repeat protein
MEMDTVHELCKNGDYLKALNIIKSLNVENELDGLILKSRLFRLTGYFKKALKMAEEALNGSKAKGIKSQELLAVINKGYVLLALENINEFEKTINSGYDLLNDLEEDDQINLKENRAFLDYLNGFMYFYKSKIELSLKFLKKALTIHEDLENQQGIAETSSGLGWIYLQGTGNQKIAFEYLQRSLSINEKICNQYYIAQSLSRLGSYYYQTQNFDKALSNYEKSVKIYQDLELEYQVAGMLNNLAHVYQELEKYEIALSFYQKYLKISEKYNHKTRVALAYGNIGLIYYYKGELNEALKFQNQSLKLKEQLGSKIYIHWQLDEIGNTYALKGEFDLALDYFTKILNLHEKEKESDISGTSIAWTYGNISRLYNLKGEPELALEYINKSLKILLKSEGLKARIAYSLTEKGIIYKTMGNYDLALRYLSEGWDLSQKVYEGGGLPLWGSYCLSHLILVARDLDDPQLAEENLKKLKKLRLQSKNDLVILRYRFAEAIVLKMSKRGGKKLQAQEKFLEIVNNEVLDQNITILSILNLCELLILEMKISDDDDVILQEIKNFTSKLSDIAMSKQSSAFTLISSGILQAKLAQIDGNLEISSNHLIEVRELASEKKLGNLLYQVQNELDILQSEKENWEKLIEQKAPITEKVEFAGLKNYVTGAEKQLETWNRPSPEELFNYIEKAKQLVNSIPKKKYQLIYQDMIEEHSKIQKKSCIVGIAQIGLSQTGDILSEFYTEQNTGLFKLKEDMVETVQISVKNMIEHAVSKGVNFIAFPELTIDLNYNQLLKDLLGYAKKYNMYIIPGSYHDMKDKKNLSILITPDGIIMEQEKHIPATIHFGGKKFKEGIKTRESPQRIIICNTEYGRIAIAICRDFLDMDLRVELKNFEPPVDLIFNPAFTPVTADFKSTHFDARRSIYAYSFFINVAEFGDSLIYTPEKERIERIIPKKEEGLIFKEVDIFKLRSERKKWEIEQKKTKPFIQSTR